MISQISGKITDRTPHGLLVDVQGISYEVLLPAAVEQAMDGTLQVGSEVSLKTFHYHQVEPSRSTPVLIGFRNNVEREFFEQFITVSGVGPKAAARALSEPIPQIAQAIDQGDAEFLRRLPGIGPQRAREIVAKLQSKVGKYALIQSPGHATQTSTKSSDTTEEALAVLKQLQYKPVEAKSMVENALKRMPEVESVEALLNEVYRQRAKKPNAFTLVELMVVVAIIGIVASMALVGFGNSIERARGAEAVSSFAFYRAGLLAYAERVSLDLNTGLGVIDGSTWDPGTTGTQADWRELGVENPNLEGSNRYFTHDIIKRGDAGHADSTLGTAGFRALANRIGDATKFVEMDLENGEISKSAPY